MTASYSHGSPEWDRKLRSAVDGLEKTYPLSYGLSYEPKAAMVGIAEVIDRVVSRLGFEPRTLALKGPLGTSKINLLRDETFQSDTRFYNGLQIGCPI